MEEFGKIVRGQMLKAFEPEIAISVIHLGATNIAAAVTKEVYIFLAEKYQTILDNDNGVIYLKRKEKT